MIIKDKLNPQVLAIEIIKHKGGMAYITEVINYIVSKKHYNGKTPRKTVNALLHRSKLISIIDGECRININPNGYRKNKD